MPAAKRRGNRLGSVAQVEGGFRASIRLGDRRRYSRHKTRQAAENWLLEQRHAWNEGHRPGGKQRLGDYLEGWLERQASSSKRRGSGLRSPLTVKEYGKKLNTYVVPILGSLWMDEITPEKVSGMIAHWRSRGLSAQTMRHTHTIFKAALSDAVRRQELHWNPVAALDPPGIPDAERHKPRVLSSDEWRAVIDSARQRRFGTAAILAAGMGLRRSEICGLQSADIHLDTDLAWLEIKHGLQRVPGEGLRLLPPKNPTSHRNLVIPAFVVEQLRDSLANEFVISNLRGDRMDPEELIRALLWPLRDEFGFPPKWGLHQLRHAIVTLVQIQTHVPFGLQAHYWGHSVQGTTLRVYTHPQLADTAQVAVAIDELYAASAKT